MRKTRHVQAQTIYWQVLSLLTLIFFSISFYERDATAANLFDPEYDMQYSLPVKWQKYLLFAHAELGSCAIEVNEGKLLVQNLSNLLPGETMELASSEQFHELAYITKEGTKQVLKLIKNDQVTSIEIPSVLVSNDWKDRWLYFSKNDVYLIRRQGLKFSYGIVHDGSWSLHDVPFSQSLPGWFYKNFRKHVFLCETGLYCVSASGEWGSGLAYYDFKGENWTNLYGFDINTERTFLCCQNELTQEIWLITDSGIFNFYNGGQKRFYGPSSVKDVDLSGLYCAIADEQNNLYLYDKKSNLWQLNGKKLFSDSKNDSPAIRLAQNLECRHLIYADKISVLYAPSNKSLAIFNVQSHKWTDKLPADGVTNNSSFYK